MNRIADSPGRLKGMAKAPVYVFATKLSKNTRTIRDGWAQGEGLEHPRCESVVP